MTKVNTKLQLFIDATAHFSYNKIVNQRSKGGGQCTKKHFQADAENAECEKRFANIRKSDIKKSNGAHAEDFTAWMSTGETEKIKRKFAGATGGGFPIAAAVNGVWISKDPIPNTK